jgi:hypothetical protein
MEWIVEADGVFRGGAKGLGLAGPLFGFAEQPEKPVKRWVNVAGDSRRDHRLLLRDAPKRFLDRFEVADRENTLHRTFVEEAIPHSQPRVAAQPLGAGKKRARSLASAAVADGSARRRGGARRASPEEGGQA